MQTFGSYRYTESKRKGDTVTEEFGGPRRNKFLDPTEIRSLKRKGTF
jgi:hypothetical protein